MTKIKVLRRFRDVENKSAKHVHGMLYTAGQTYEVDFEKAMLDDLVKRGVVKIEDEPDSVSVVIPQGSDDVIMTVEPSAIKELKK